MYGKDAHLVQDFSGKYIIWSPGATHPPKKVFDCRSDAIKAAMSMAGKFPNQQFIVCKVVGSANTAKVEYKDLEA